MIGLARTAALEVGRTGVRVNAVLPGNIRTKMTKMVRQFRRPRRRCRERAARRPAGAAGEDGTAEEIADAVCFLASDAARHITGIELPVDGGILASTYGTAYGAAASS